MEGRKKNSAGRKVGINRAAFVNTRRCSGARENDSTRSRSFDWLRVCIHFYQLLRTRRLRPRAGPFLPSFFLSRSLCLSFPPFHFSLAASRSGCCCCLCRAPLFRIPGRVGTEREREGGRRARDINNGRANQRQQ